MIKVQWLLVLFCVVLNGCGSLRKEVSSPIVGHQKQIGSKSNNDKFSQSYYRSSEYQNFESFKINEVPDYAQPFIEDPIQEELDVGIGSHSVEFHHQTTSSGGLLLYQSFWYGGGIESRVDRVELNRAIIKVSLPHDTSKNRMLLMRGGLTWVWRVEFLKNGKKRMVLLRNEPYSFSSEEIEDVISFNKDVREYKYYFGHWYQPGRLKLNYTEDANNGGEKEAVYICPHLRTQGDSNPFSISWPKFEANLTFQFSEDVNRDIEEKLSNQKLDLSDYEFEVWFVLDRAYQKWNGKYDTFVYDVGIESSEEYEFFFEARGGSPVVDDIYSKIEMRVRVDKLSGELKIPRIGFNWTVEKNGVREALPLTGTIMVWLEPKNGGASYIMGSYDKPYPIEIKASLSNSKDNIIVITDKFNPQ